MHLVIGIWGKPEGAGRAPTTGTTVVMQHVLRVWASLAKVQVDMLYLVL